MREEAASLLPGGPAIEVPELPIYHQIARQIHARIYHELYRPGDAIPSENELGQEFGVSRLTIRQALRQLTHQGVLHTRRGHGTFVADRPRLVRPVNFIGYLDDLVLQALTIRTSLRRIEVLAPPSPIREVLRLGRSESVLVVERTGWDGDEPVNHALNYLPNRVARRIPHEEFGESSVIEVLKRHGIEVTSASQTLGAAAASPPIATSLEVPPGAPVVRTEIVLVAGERPVNLSILHYRADRSYFTANLVGLGNGSGRRGGNGRGGDRNNQAPLR